MNHRMHHKGMTRTVVREEMSPPGSVTYIK